MNAVQIGAQSLKLEAQQDESLLVRDVLCTDLTATRLVATVGQRTVGAWRSSGPLGNHLRFPEGEGAGETVAGMTLLGYLFEKELWRGIPVPAGYTLTLAGAGASGDVVMAVYDRYDGGDIRADQPNGPEGGELDYLSYGQMSAAKKLAGSYELTEPESDDSFPPFPYGAPAPANHDTTIYGILASTFAPSENDGTNDAATQYLRFVDQRRILGDKNRSGYLLFEALGNQTVDAVGKGSSLIHNMSSTDEGLPLLFREPLMFSGGEELQIFQQLHSAGTGASINQADSEVCLIMRSVRRR